MADMGAGGCYRQQSVVLAVAVLSVMLIAALVAISWTRQLNHLIFLRFPLGFYVIAQGFLILLVIAGFWFARAQDRLDRALGDSGEY